jgi:hypothetical protein
MMFPRRNLRTAGCKDAVIAMAACSVRRLLPAVFGAVLAAPASAQDAFGDAFWQFRASAGFDYSSGTYGAASKTDITYSYAMLRATKGPWTLKAVVPWMTLSGPAVLVDGAAGGSLASGQSRHVSGPGDINLYAGYSLQSLYPRGLFVDLTARVKVPTASFAKGLGTGKADGAFQIDVAQALGGFMPFATFGYRITGRPDGYQLRNIVYGTAGVQYGWSERLATGVLFDYRQTSLPSAADPKEGTAYVNYKFADAWSVNLYGLVGFSRNSPDGGGGVVLTYRWP